MSQLAPLGEIAGVGGMAVGAVVLLVRPLIDRSGWLPAAQRGRLFQTIATGAFAIGALGIAAWLIGSLYGGPSASTAGNESPAVISHGNVSIGPGAAPPARAPAAASAPALSGSAKTLGSQSPAIISGGNATVAIPPGTPAPASRQGTQ